MIFVLTLIRQRVLHQWLEIFWYHWIYAIFCLSISFRIWWRALRLTAWYCLRFTFCKWLDSHPTAVARGSPPNNARRDAARSAAMASDQCHGRWTWKWIEDSRQHYHGMDTQTRRQSYNWNPVGLKQQTAMKCNQQCHEDPLPMRAGKVQCWQSRHFWPIGQDAFLSSQFSMQTEVRWAIQSPLFFASGNHFVENKNT